MTDQNYILATRHYSYAVLARSLQTIITNITGVSDTAIDLY